METSRYGRLFTKGYLSGPGCASNDGEYVALAAVAAYGEVAEDGRRRTEDRGRMSEVGGAEKRRREEEQGRREELARNGATARRSTRDRTSDVGGGPRSEDRGQRTEDGGWKTEDRGRKNEERGTTNQAPITDNR